MKDQLLVRRSAIAGPEAGLVLAGGVAGHGLFRMAPADVPALRKRPGPVPEDWGTVPPSLLRYADEQSVAGTAAVFTAVHEMGLARDSLANWGVVAAPRYLGRANLAQALRNFLAEGVWGTSPHLIPHFALHSLSGTISLALGTHGPNLGTGGGLHSAAEGFLAALTWISAGDLPGVWLILSGWSPELIPDDQGGAPHAGECRALAIALVAPDAPHSGAILRARVAAGLQRPLGAVDLPALASALAVSALAGPLRHTIATDPAGRLRIELARGYEAEDDAT